MIKESDMIVGQKIVDAWYYPGESGEIVSIKGRMLRAKFGIRNVRHIVLRDGIHEEHKILWSNIYHIDDLLRSPLII